MEIQSLSIKNFKGISDLELKPKKMNILVGRNNTGKTSFLQAINLLFNRDEIKSMYPRHISSIINVGSESSELSAMVNNVTKSLDIKKIDEQEAFYAFKKDLITQITRDVKNFDKNDEIDIKRLQESLEDMVDEYMTSDLKSNILKDTVVTIENKDRKSRYYNIDYLTGNPKLRIMSMNIMKKISAKFKLNKFHNDYFLYRPLYYFLDRPLSLKHKKRKDVVFISNPLDEIEKISKQKKTEKATEKLHELEHLVKKHNLVGNLERLDFDYVIFNKTGKHIIPFSFLGDGFKAMIGLLWFISSKEIKDKVVLLDEVGIHMHPGYIRELIKMIILLSESLNIQFFISTHNSDFIETLFEKDIFTKNEQKYLDNEIQVLRMETIKNHTISEVLNYKDASYTRDKLLLDLRGI